MQLVNLILNLAQENKYIILFFVYLIEGPNAGFISAMLAATGEVDIFIVSILLLIAEIGADLFYYYLGKTLSETKLQKKISKYERGGLLANIKKLLQRSPIKALVLAKSIGFIAVPTIILIGKYQTIKPKKFILWTSVTCLIKDSIILMSGYFLGLSSETFLIGYSTYKVVAVVIAIIILVYILLRLNREKIEKVTLKILKRV